LKLRTLKDAFLRIFIDGFENDEKMLKALAIDGAF